MLHCQNIFLLELIGDASSQAKGTKSTSFLACVPLTCEDAGDAIEIIEVVVEEQLDLVTEVDEVMLIRDLIYVYLNRYEFQFSRFHINKQTNVAFSCVTDVSLVLLNRQYGN